MDCYVSLSVRLRGRGGGVMGRTNRMAGRILDYIAT